MNKCITFVTLWFMLVGPAFAASGDIILTDLHETTSLPEKTKRHIVSFGGAPGGSGVAAVVNATDGDATVTWSYGMPASLKEVTVVWWERYSVWPLTWSLGGCKSIRQYNGPDSQDYFGAFISYWGDNSMYVSPWNNATVFFNTDVVTSVKEHKYTDDGMPELISNSTYFSPARMAWAWEGMGTSWRKMRYWIKMPTNLASADAEQKLWIDNQLHFHLYNATLKNSSGRSVPYITSITMAPVDESATPHEHWYDEITIYEGYVPPDGTPLPDPDPGEPAPTTSGPILHTGSHLLRVGDSVLRVQ